MSEKGQARAKAEARARAAEKEMAQERAKTEARARASTGSSSNDGLSWKEKAARIQTYHEQNKIVGNWLKGIIVAILAFLIFFLPVPIYIRIGLFILFAILAITYFRSGASGIGGFFKKFGGFLFVGAVVGIIIIGFMYGANQSGWVEVAGAKGTMVEYKIQEDGNAWTTFQKGFRGFWTGEGIQEQFAWQSDVEQNENNVFLGLEIKEFFSMAPGSIYASRDPIILQATLAGQSLTRDLDVKMSCSLEDYLGKDIEVSPEEFELASISDAYLDEEYAETVMGETYYHVTCIFPEGLYFPDIFFERKDTKQLSRTAEIKADYEFITNATWEVYFIGEGMKREADAEGKPSLWPAAKNPRVDLISGVVRGISTHGPMNIGFYVGTRTFKSPQPFVFGSETPLYFNVDLSKNPEWSGYLNEVQDFLLHVPPPLEFTIDERFCDFKDTGLRDGYGNKLYKITDHAYKTKVNIDCTDEEVRNKLFGEPVSEQDCISRYKDTINLNCQFKIKDAYDDKAFIKYVVFAESKYVFSDREWTLVNIRKGILDEDVCQDKTETQCKTPGCKIIYDFNNTFLECTECSASLKKCENYILQEDCQVDECNFGSCYWVDLSEEEGGCLKY
ncbi:MAG: hypothetical protein ABH849_05080 [Nanoarchaeota archaeon]